MASLPADFTENRNKMRELEEYKVGYAYARFTKTLNMM